jgi:hypothetical protein
MKRIVQAQALTDGCYLLGGGFWPQHQPGGIAQQVGEEEDGDHQPEQDNDGMKEPSQDVAADDEPPSPRVERRVWRRSTFPLLRRPCDLVAE